MSVCFVSFAVLIDAVCYTSSSFMFVIYVNRPLIFYLDVCFVGGYLRLNAFVYHFRQHIWNETVSVFDVKAKRVVSSCVTFY